MPIVLRRVALALLTTSVLGCAGGSAASAPPAFDSTRAAVSFAESAAAADLVVHIEVTTRLNEVLPHHMAHAQLAFINRTDAPIALPQLGPDALNVDGDIGRLRTKTSTKHTDGKRITLAPGEMLVSNVDLLDVFDFPATGGRFRIRFDGVDGMPSNLRLQTNADYFTVGPRRL